MSASVDPVPDEPVAVADCGGERALVVADYHAGLEAALRFDGVEIRSRAPRRRETVLRLVAARDVDRVVFLGDLGHAIGTPGSEEETELDDLLSALTSRVPVTVVKGNHDGGVEDVVAELGLDRVTVTPASGTGIGRVGFAHGHTWPAREVLEREVVCVAHEHPVVRLEDEVGGRRVERAWLRGRLNPEPFADHLGEPVETAADLVVFPAFNDLTGGTWVNVEGQGFLSPFLPEGLVDGQAYLLDGTRLGDYRRV